MNNSAKHKKTGSGRRLTAMLLAFLLTACVLSAAAFSTARTAQAFGVSPENETSVNRASAQDFFDGILSYLRLEAGCSSDDPQALINESLGRQPSQNVWFLFALSQYGVYDFQSTEKALKDSFLYLASPLKGTEVQKYALFSLAIGSDLAPYDPSLLAESVGSQGIMSLVFGLHLLNNGAVLGDHTAEETVQKILSLRLADGGWAISGTYSDVDVTSMVVQALAVYCKTAGAGASGSSSENAAKAVEAVEDVAEAVNHAVELLAGRQNEDGGFSSYGAANCESCAQVLVALSTVGIDACRDERFIKNGRTILDAIRSFRLDNGSFRHVADGETNRTATQQVFYASIAYMRFLDGRPSLYELDAVREGRSVTPKPTGVVTPTGSITPIVEPTSSVDEPTPTASVLTPTTGALTPVPGTPSDSATLTPSAGNPTPGGASKADDAQNTPGNSDADIPSYRLWGSGILALIAAVLLTVLAYKRRLTRRNLLLFAGVFAALFALLWFVKIQTPEQYYASLAVSDEEAAGSVTLSIRCDTVAGIDGLPADGMLLAPVKIAYREGDTVYDALTAAAAKARLPLDIGGAGGSLYIRGIGTLHEFDHGTLSGWMYYVNNEAPSESCSARKLRDGDIIEWRYTRDMGVDTEQN